MLQFIFTLFVIQDSVLAANAFSSADSKCSIADSAVVVSSRKNLFLVYRITGFQEKAEFLEIYDSKPQFDSCGQPSKPPLASELIDETKGFLKRLQWKNGKLQIIYTKNRAKAVTPTQLELSY